MKQFLSLLTGLLVCLSAAYATHVRGGYIEYEWIEGNTYDIRAVIFRDVSGVSMGPLTLSISGIQSETFILQADTGENLEQAALGSERYIFTKRYTFPPVPFLGITVYKVSVLLQNRNPTVLNISRGPSDLLSFYVESEIRLSSLMGRHSSIRFPDTNALFLLNTDQNLEADLSAPWSDGDSLAYRLVPPMIDLNRHVDFYRSPASIEFCGACTFTLDAQTGLMRFSAPERPGEYTVAVQVEKWRSVPNSNRKFRVGYVNRDIQIIVRG